MNLDLGDTRLLIEACKTHGLLRNQAAYVLATAYHETAHTIKPVREYGGETYLKKKKYYPYVGMGYVQLTWDYNYKKASDKLGVDFLKNPKLLLEPKYAAPIIVIGMMEGWFTGKKLSDYITLKVSDFKSARKIVNGLDKAELIADYAKQYDKMLKDIGYGEQMPVILPSSPVQPLPDDPGVIHPEIPRASVVRPKGATNAPSVPAASNPFLDIIFAILSFFTRRK